MGRYLLLRLLLIVPAAIAASLIIFFVMRVLPGDVALTILSGSPHTDEMRETLREELGLNDPLLVQYGSWARRMFNGEFGGTSLQNREPIRLIIGRQLPATVLLTIYSVLLSIFVSIPLGILAAVWRNRWPDVIIRIATLGGLSLPHVWTAHLIILLLLAAFRWSPPIIYSTIREDPWNHFQIMIWPTLLLTWEYSSHLVRVTRSSVVEMIERDFIAAARGKGLPEYRVIVKYAVRNAAIPVVTMVGLQFGALLSGTLVLETIFGIPGIGRGLIQAAIGRDYPVVQSIGTMLVLLYLVMNLIVDAAYAVIDPRTRQ